MPFDNFNYHFKNSNCWNDGHVFYDHRSKIHTGGSVVYAPSADRRHICSDGTPFPRPTRQLKSWWNNPKPMEGVINGHPVKYYVHTYGVRGQKCLLEVVEGPAHLQSYVTRTHQAASEAFALQGCLKELQEKADRYKTPEQVGERWDVPGLYDAQKVVETLHNNDQDPREVKKEKFPEDDIVDSFPRNEPKKQKSHLNMLTRVFTEPGKKVKRASKSMLAESESLAKLSETFACKRNEMNNLVKSLDAGIPGSAKIEKFFDRNPQLSQLKTASPQEQRAWFQHMSKRFDSATKEAKTSSDRHSTVARILTKGSKKYLEEVKNSGFTFQDQLATNLGNHLFDIASGTESLSVASIADAGFDALGGTIETICTNVVIDVVEDLVKDNLSTQVASYVPGMDKVVFATKIINQLSQANDLKDCVTIGAEATIKISTQYAGQALVTTVITVCGPHIISQTLIPVPVLGPLAGVFVGRTIEYVVRRTFS